MADIRCRYCGQAFKVELEEGQDPEALEPELRVCATCSDSRRDKNDSDGTIMLPPEAANVLGHPQKPKPSSKRDASGRSFGSYQIIEEVSRGSFGVVYRAQQKGLDRVVALKVLLAGAHASPDMVSRFQREARAAARVKHASIVPIYDIGMEDEHHYFAMEFIEGESLSAHINRGLPIQKALAIAEDLADAMSTAHEQGVVHRDLKPSNIILDANEKPHITDFGLAKQVDLDTRYTQSGTTLGTPAYMPPEQARGEIETVDARSDVYALGAILYEMLTGTPPFGGRSLLEVVVAVLNEPVRPPRQINPKIHRDVQTIVLKCLEKQPGQRYASAGDLRDDILRFRSGEAIRARPIGPLRHAGRFVRRHAFFFLAVATVLLAVGLSALQVRNMQRQMQSEKEKEREERAELEKQKREEERKKGQAEWKPFWWFPVRPEDNLTREERALFGNGFVRPRIRYVPAWVQGSERVLPATEVLVSPEQKRIFGDLEAQLHFRLSARAAGRGVRVGIQSHEGALPFMLTIRPGRLTLVGPKDLYVTGNQARSPMEIKAEKRGPTLVAGEYVLVVRREGLHLSFLLRPPEQADPVQICIWDLGLSHWKFKNTQVSIRQAPKGFEIVKASILRKSSPERLDDLRQAIGFFHNGEYNGAEAELDAIVTKEAADEKDLFKIAQADFYLGLIQEVCQPQVFAEARHYARALDTLSRCPIDAHTQLLEARLRLRRLLLFARQRRWARAEEERGRLVNLMSRLPAFTPATPGIGEPYAWELVPLLTTALKRNESEPKELAFSLFKILGLKPGSKELAEAAKSLGRDLVTAKRYDDLLALHKAYSTRELLPAFAQAVAALERAGDSAQSFAFLDYAIQAFPGQEKALQSVAGTLLKRALQENDHALATRTLERFPRPGLATALRQFLQGLKTAPPEEALGNYNALLSSIHKLKLPHQERKAMTAAVVRLAGLLLNDDRWTEIQELHTSWPTVELGPKLAQSVLALAIGGADEANDAALAILRYAYASPLKNVPALHDAAVQLARNGVGPAGKDNPALILSVQRAFPTPKLLDVAREALRNLIKRKAQSDALSFFASARVAFGGKATELTPQIVDLLRSLPMDQASQALTDLRATVRQPLEGRTQEEHRWQLECGDLYLVIGRRDRAADLWSELTTTDNLEPELISRATIRLCGLNLADDKPLPLAIWTPATAEDGFPEEARLLARYVTGSLVSQELKEGLRLLEAPKFFSAAEWDVARALRARAEGRLDAADRYLWSAAQKAGPDRAWPSYLLNTDQRIFQ